MAERERRRIQHLQATALLILAAATVLTLVYVAKLILVVILLSILLSFVLAPIVDLLTRFNIPRALGALLAVLMLVIALVAATYLSYSRALAFMYEVPKYKARIQALGAKLREQARADPANHRDRAALLRRRQEDGNRKAVEQLDGPGEQECQLRIRGWCWRLPLSRFWFSSC